MKRKPIILALDFQGNGNPIPGRTEYRSGLTTRISWRRLVEDLRTSGNIRDTETVKRLEIDEDGITIVLDTTAQA